MIEIEKNWLKTQMRDEVKLTKEDQIPGNQENPINVQIGGDHYKCAVIQPVDFIVKNNLGFLEGCVIKRIYRYNKNGGKGAEDLMKAQHEIALLMRSLAANTEGNGDTRLVKGQDQSQDERDLHLGNLVSDDIRAAIVQMSNHQLSDVLDHAKKLLQHGRGSRGRQKWLEWLKRLSGPELKFVLQGGESD